jgi:hypothetical protein
LNEEPWTESPRLCVCLSFFFRGNFTIQRKIQITTGTKKCWRLFQKVFFFFSFFATRIQQKPNIKAGPKRDKQKKKKRNAHPPIHPPLCRQGVCVCVRARTTAIEMCVLEEVRYHIPKFAAAAAAANGWLQVPAAATHAMDHAVALA